MENESPLTNFNEEEQTYIRQSIDSILAIYEMMRWNSKPERRELEKFICEAVARLRQDDLDSIRTWRVSIQRDDLSPHEFEIFVAI
jgi:hypothetical protein